MQSVYVILIRSPAKIKLFMLTDIGTDWAYSVEKMAKRYVLCKTIIRSLSLLHILFEMVASGAQCNKCIFWNKNGPQASSDA